MTSPEQKQSPQQAARRKLVRGAFAVPAVMTVVSGSAVAAQSSLVCLANHVGSNTSVTPKVGSLDTYTRIQLHLATDGKYYVSGSHVSSVFNTSNSVYPALGTWLEINVDTGAPATSGGYTTPNSVMPSGATLNYQNPKYVVVRFDNEGNVTGIGTAGTGANVGASCWNSFRPNV